MKFQSDRMLLNCIQTVLQGERAQVYICVDEMGTADSTYTLVCLKDHTISKQILMASLSEGIQESEYLIDHFVSGGMDILVFPYAQKRPLLDFYFGDVLTLEEVETICRNVVLSALQSRLPSPILYMVLEQKLFQLAKDHNVYVSYEMDFNRFDAAKTESDCVVVCARLLIQLLEEKSAQKNVTYQLLKKRSRSQGYLSFAQLYKDVIMSGSPGGKRGIIARLRSWFVKNKDRLFVILMWICVVLAVVAAASFLTQLIFGDVPWLRVFFNGFKVIGTEHLNSTT